MSDRPTPFTDLLIAEYHNARWPNSSQASLTAFIDSNRRFERQLAEAERQRDAALGSLEMMLETVAEPPASNCSCHISAPCSDCVDFGGLREAFGLARAVLREIEGES